MLETHRSLAVARGGRVQILHFYTLTIFHLRLALLLLDWLWPWRHVVWSAMIGFRLLWIIGLGIFRTGHICHRPLLRLWGWLSCLDLLVDGLIRFFLGYDSTLKLIFVVNFAILGKDGCIWLIKGGLSWHRSVVHHLRIIIQSLICDRLVSPLKIRVYSRLDLLLLFFVYKAKLWLSLRTALLYKFVTFSQILTFSFCNRVILSHLICSLSLWLLLIWCWNLIWGYLGQNS